MKDRAVSGRHFKSPPPPWYPWAVPLSRGIALLIFAALVMGVLHGVPGTATAQDAGGEEDPEAEDRAARHEAEARTLFEAGRMAFTDGRFEDALDSFERAYELTELPVLLFNIGTSLDRLQRNSEAISAFEGYLEGVPDAENRSEVESRLAALRGAHAREVSQADQLREEEERRRALEAEIAARDEAGTPLYEKWWFWTIVGALLVGGAVTAGVLLYDPGQQDPSLGSTGQVTFTLGGS